MQAPLRSSILVAVALIGACDAPDSPTETRIEVRSASLEDDSMLLDVSIGGQDREVRLFEGSEMRAVAVLAPTAGEPTVTIVSEAQRECVTDDAVACELVDAAFDGTLEQLAEQVDDTQQFRRTSLCPNWHFYFENNSLACISCSDTYWEEIYCQSFP